MKKAFVGFVCVCLIISLLTLGTIAQNTEKSYNWYCIRNKDHRQPRVDSEVSFIEEYNGYHIDKKHGDTCSEKMLYLTFDAGYENGYTAMILDALKKHDAPATFFLVGHYLETAPDLVMRMVEEGHTIANHTWSHPDMSVISSEETFAEELSKMEEKYLEMTGEEMPRFYRPPQGKYNLQNLKMAKDLGYHTFFWSLAYADWKVDDQPSKEDAMKKLVDRIHPGAIVLLHSTSKTNGEILDDLLTAWEEMGYRFGDLQELIK